jgi:ubiquinone/menaquinone biosynthesis C-methylase UbiE
MENNIIDIYNEIASEFDLFRTKVWPCVAKFLNSLPSNCNVLDIGCGNGKNFTARNDINMTGIDLTENFVTICKAKGYNVSCASMTQLPFEDNTFDAFIAVASYHHLDNDYDRKQTLNEMYRVLKPNGMGLIVVWAMEQGDRSKFHFTKTDEFVEWRSHTGKVYNRYYHIYREGDLKEEVLRLKPEFIVGDIGWQKGNYYTVLTK